MSTVLGPSVATAQRVATRSHDTACRMLDLVLATSLLLLALPLMLLIAVAIKLDSPGPAIFRQRRLGLAMEPFTVLKFRTMWDGASSEAHRRFVQQQLAGERAGPAEHAEQSHRAERQGAPVFKLAGDARITRLGRILRSSSLDELPQLVNVIRGEMSLVGPRPAIPYETGGYDAECFGRFEVKPGLTGLWQVSGRNALSMPDMLRLDLEYVSRRSLRLNLWIVLRTVPALLSRRGAA